MANRKIKESFAKTKFSTTLKNICGDKVIATADTIADLDYNTTLADGTVTEGAYQSEVNKLHADAIEELQKSKTSVNFNTRDIVLNESTSKYEFANPGDAIIARGVYDADGNETDVLDTTQFVANHIYIINKAFKVESFSLPNNVHLYFEVGGSFTGSSDNVTVSCNYSNTIKTCSQHWILKNIFFNYQLNGATICADWFENNDDFINYVSTTIAPFTTRAIVDITLILGTSRTTTLDFSLPSGVQLNIIGEHYDQSFKPSSYAYVSGVYDNIDTSSLGELSNTRIYYKYCNVVPYGTGNRQYQYCAVTLSHLETPFKDDVQKCLLLIDKGTIESAALRASELVDSYITEYNASADSEFYLGSTQFINCYINLTGNLNFCTFYRCHFYKRVIFKSNIKCYDCSFDKYFFLKLDQPNSSSIKIMNCTSDDKMMINVPPKYAAYNYVTDSWDYIEANSVTTPPSLSNCTNVLGFRHLNYTTDRVSIRGKDHWIELANIKDVEDYRLAWKIIE